MNLLGMIFSMCGLMLKVGRAGVMISGENQNCCEARGPGQGGHIGRWSEALRQLGGVLRVMGDVKDQAS